MPGAELQARWAARVLAGKCNLPSKEVMANEIKQEKASLLERYKKINTLSVSAAVYSKKFSIDFRSFNKNDAAQYSQKMLRSISDKSSMRFDAKVSII